MQERVSRLEEQLAFLERHVEQLDGVVRDLSDRLDAARAEMSRLAASTKREMEALRQAGDEDDDDPTRDVPPHWGGGKGTEG